MNLPIRRARDARDVRLALWVTAAVVLCWLLDRCSGPIAAQRADIFGAIWSGIEQFATSVAGVSAGLASNALNAVKWLGASLGWLANRVSDILLNVGKMFAKVWEGLKVVWNDVLKPALKWLDEQWNALKSWLKDTFGPVFDFLDKVRQDTQTIYTRFIRPVLDALDIAHVVLKTLADLGVEWAKKLDGWVLRVEHVITDNFQRLTGWINELRDILTSVVTPDRLIQRMPFLRTIERDMGYVVAGFWKHQIRDGVTNGDDYARTRMFPLLDEEKPGQQLAEYFSVGGGEYAGLIDDLVPTWRIAAGVDPPPDRPV